MTSVLTRAELVKNSPVQVDGYRVRLVEVTDVPVLKSLEGLVGPEVVLFDLPEAGDLEKENLELRQQRLVATPNQTIRSDVDEQDGEEASAQEHHFAVWTLSSLEANAGLKETLDAFASAARNEEEPAYDLHLCPSKNACSYDRSTLSQNRELFEDLASGGYFFMTDASGPLRMLFRGHVKQEKKLTSFVARSLGTLSDSMNKLERLSTELGTNAKLTGLKCRSRYDVLAPAANLAGNHDFIPARFYVDSEWSVHVPREKARKHWEPKQAHIPEFFSKPSPHTVAKITFRPGWLDQRLANHSRSLDLKFILTLCDFLENRACAWPETQEQPEVIERVIALIQEERNRREASGYDFTELLWQELRHCRSHATASKAFELIFDEMRTGTFKVRVRPDNESSLSHMLRSHRPATEIIRVLEPLYCAHLLVGLGLDRLKRDIYGDFIGGGLLHTTADLDEMLPSADQLEGRARALLVMHLAQQSLMTIHKFMLYQRTDLSRLGGRLLEHFNLAPLAEKFRAEFTFEAPISYFTLAALQSVNIQEWSVQRTWAGNDGEIPDSDVDLILLSLRPLLDHTAPYRMKSKKLHDAQEGVADVSVKSRAFSEGEDADPKAYHCIHVLADSVELNP
ncbi:ZWL-1 protein [Aphelenchoides avenae]|nr:ZWL-1 protein [Aphelenchus avenae]